MKHLLGLVAALTLLIGTTGHAGLLIEPYMGYHFGKIKGGGSSETVTGPTYGGRLGFSSLGFQAGVDYMGGQWTIDSDPKFKGSASNLGAFVAYSFPLLFRVYGSYFFDAKLKDDVTYKGNAMRFGVGLSPLPLIDINLEYATVTYDKVDSFTITGTKPKMDLFGITLSIPFNL